MICNLMLEFSYILCMKNVLLIDSGSGGVNILKECVKVCPECNFLLFCDDKNLPYGNKSAKALQECTARNLENIKKFFDFDIVVLACNTLTCTCLSALRKNEQDIIFIGTEPAIKPALERYDEKDILVLSTDVTLRQNRLLKKHKNLKKQSLPELAGFIDNNLDNLEVLRPYLVEKLNDFLQKDKKPKAIVLGCTHYLAAKNILQEIFGNEVEIFDSANGVARRLKHFVEQSVQTSQSFQVQIMTSLNSGKLQSFWWWFQN